MQTREKYKCAQNVQVKNILILYESYFQSLILIIVQITMNTTAMRKKDVLNSQIKWR